VQRLDVPGGGADGVGQILLADPRDERRARLALGRRVEQMAGDALTDRRERAGRDLGDERARARSARRVLGAMLER
jgi:hypothetical protein